MLRLRREAFTGFNVRHFHQARGRGERANRTPQDRLVYELRVSGIRTVAEANRYLEERFRPEYNRLFAHPARDPASAARKIHES